jgi:hypothetical protein
MRNEQGDEDEDEDEASRSRLIDEIMTTIGRRSNLGDDVLQEVADLDLSELRKLASNLHASSGILSSSDVDDLLRASLSAPEADNSAPPAELPGNAEGPTLDLYVRSNVSLAQITRLITALTCIYGEEFVIEKLEPQPPRKRIIDSMRLSRAAGGR